MSELDDLYQEVILDHNRKPRNFGQLPGANRTAKGDNPLCGDQLQVQLKVREGRIVGIAFEGHGCAISTASASLMTEAVKGKTVEEAEKLFHKVHELLTGGAPPDEGLGKLQALTGVREYPMRVKCATLSWHTLHTALADPGATVSTEGGAD
jgi:nitrogen fixation NifU-like protein